MYATEWIYWRLGVYLTASIVMHVAYFDMLEYARDFVGHNFANCLCVRHLCRPLVHAIVRIRMARVNNYRVVQVGKRQDLRINVESARVVKRQVQTLLRLQGCHKVAG